MATKGFNTLLQRGCAVQAFLVTGVVGNNNAIRWTAQTEGTGGNSIRITITTGGGALSVTVAGNDIAVEQAVGGSTATAVIAAVKASETASALVTVKNQSTSTGVGLVADMIQTALATGSASVTYTSIANVLNISGPSLSLGTVETTHQVSTAGWREFIATLKDVGEVTFEVNFLPTDDTQNWILGLIHDVNQRTLRALRVIWTDTAATQWDFSGFVTRFQPAGPVDGKLSASLAVKISGQPTLA